MAVLDNLDISKYNEESDTIFKSVVNSQNLQDGATKPSELLFHLNPFSHLSPQILYGTIFFLC